MVEDEELTHSFCAFMASRFPDSGYMEKRKAYFEKARIMQKVQEELLFFD